MNIFEQRKEIASLLRNPDSLNSEGCIITSGICLKIISTLIANLIDPTCKPVVDDVHGMDDGLVCSECGCFLAIVVDGKPSEPLYRYCPSCGARIVRDE